MQLWALSLELLGMPRLIVHGSHPLRSNPSLSIDGSGAADVTGPHRRVHQFRVLGVADGCGGHICLSGSDREMTAEHGRHQPATTTAHGRDLELDSITGGSGTERLIETSRPSERLAGNVVTANGTGSKVANSTIATDGSFLETRRGKLTLALLCAVAFLDFVDASIVNVALPDIRRDLGFSTLSEVSWSPAGCCCSSSRW